MAEDIAATAANAGQDRIVPFLLNGKPVRGRVVRLSDSVHQVLSQHAYPPLISSLLAETMAMAAILSSSLKQDGIFTVQIQSKGPLSLLVVDATHEGHLRGYAQFDETALPKEKCLDVLCQEGYMAITLDMGPKSQRYQGVVPLEGASVAETMQHYFTQSQQLDIQCKLAVGQHYVDGEPKWMAGGIYVEKVAEDAGQEARSEEAWREASILLQTVKDSELLDPSLSSEQLLYRLFHEEGVWVYDASPVTAQCRCNRYKIKQALCGFEQAALEEMAVNGSIVADCQFCGRKEIFALNELVVAGT